MSRDSLVKICKDFFMWTIFFVFIEFVITFLLFLFLFVLVFWPQVLCDLSSPARARTNTLALEVQSLNHWTAREVP